MRASLHAMPAVFQRMLSFSLTPRGGRCARWRRAVTSDQAPQSRWRSRRLHRWFPCLRGVPPSASFSNRMRSSSWLRRASHCSLVPPSPDKGQTMVSRRPSQEFGDGSIQRQNVAECIAKVFSPDRERDRLVVSARSRARRMHSPNTTRKKSSPGSSSAMGLLSSCYRGQ